MEQILFCIRVYRKIQGGNTYGKSKWIRVVEGEGKISCRHADTGRKDWYDSRGTSFSTQGVERLGIPPLVMSDGPMGVRQEFEPDHWKAVGGSADYATYLPCNSALAATWNRDLASATGSVLGAEARGRGKDIILAPGINIKRSPLCGRNFEYFSEDPYLTGELAVCFIQGIQQWDVAACVKHFAVNNQETQRLWTEVEIDEAALREIYLPAFYECLTRGKACR